ncbi:MAG: hypothetical protein U0790_05940 [Isosphaeraceae bacterium]
MDVQPGVLAVSSRTRVELVDASGLTLLSRATGSVSTAIAALTGAPSRQSYRVVDPGALGLLRWNSPAPQVNVLVESLLTLYPESAEWTAVLNYDIRGGSLDSFALKIPTVWAQRAQVELDGGSDGFRSNEMGPLSFWRILLGRPAWGPRRLVLRSSIPLAPGQEIEHPEIRPLGEGRLDTYLGLVAATGSPPTTEWSSSLKEAMDDGRFSDPDFWKPPGARLRVFHVARDRWSLKAQIPSAQDEPQGRAPDSARVVAAELGATVREDRSLLARGVYETQARTGRFLIAAPAPDSELLWTTVDQAPVRPFAAADGRWLIPLDEDSPHRVCVYWRGALEALPAAGSAQASRAEAPEWVLELPRVGDGHPPVLATIRAPEGLAIRPAIGDLEAVPTARLELERAHRIARQLNEFLQLMDRRSGRDRERVTSFVIAHELALRSADRSLRSAARRGGRADRERIERELEIVQSARKTFFEGLSAGSLDDAIGAALNYLGQPAAPANRASTLAVAGPSAPDRIRGLGQPTCLMGVTGGLDGEATRISAVGEAARKSELSPERAQATLILGLLAAPALLILARPGRAGTWLLTLALAMGMLGFLGGPILLVPGLLALGGGWLSGPSSRPGATALPRTA